jgi:hypothetical protein
MLRGWQKNWEGQGGGASVGPMRYLDVFGRSMSALDEATRDVLTRAGASGEEAARAVLMGTPRTWTGNKLLELVKGSGAARLLLPFAKTGVNILESGLERTPGVGLLPQVQAWAQTPRDLLMRRQALGALAMLAGAGTGAAMAEGGPLEDYRRALPFVEAAGATYALPLALGARAGRALTEGGGLMGVGRGIVQGVQEQAPVPRTLNPNDALGDLMRQYLVPYGGALDLFSTVEPSQLGGPKSAFRNVFADVPILNELLAESVARRARPAFTSATTPAWMRD